MEPIFFKSPLLRYYTAYTWQYQSEHPLLIRIHSNKLFLIFLHPEHPAMSQNIQKLSYKLNTSSLSGKRKKGAVNLQANSHLLEIITDIDTYSIRAGVPGKLIETNDLIVECPELVKQPEGFLAIVMPPLSKIENILQTLTKVDSLPKP